MHARSAVVDLYGDHLRPYGWWAPVSAVVALAEGCGVHPPATRTAISRLVREGWLRAEARDGRRGYAATPLAQERLLGAHERIYATGPRGWDGTWHVVVVDHHGDRRRRDQVAASLGYLGYGRLGPATWISPWPSPELAATLDGHGAGWTGVTGQLRTGQDPAAAGAPGGAPARVASSVWDLGSLAGAYDRFVSSLPGAEGLADLDPPQAYRVRTDLVHRWRKFLFVDPGLPHEVLPGDWVGHRARARFLHLAEVLRPAAQSHVSRTLGEPEQR